MSRLYKWPQEVIDWLKENVPGRTAKELAAMANEQGLDKLIGRTFTPDTIKQAKQRYHIKSGTPCGHPKGYSPKFPEGMADYIRSIAPGRSSEEIARMTAEHFGIEFTTRQCQTYRKNHDIPNGRDCRYKKGNVPWSKGQKMTPEMYAKAAPTMFKKGDVPANHMEVGEYTHTSDGYLIQKVKETGIQRERFVFVHRATWEKYHGPIPEGKMVTFLDGNKDNCNIDNLVLVDNAVNLEMNRRGLRFDDPDLTAAGVNVSKLRVKDRQRQKEATT